MAQIVAKEVTTNVIVATSVQGPPGPQGPAGDPGPTGPTAAATQTLRTNDYQLLAADAGVHNQFSGSTKAFDLWVPLNSREAIAVGQEFLVNRGDTLGVLINPESGVTIRSTKNRLSLADIYSPAVLKKIATNEWLLIGDLAPWQTLDTFSTTANPASDPGGTYTSDMGHPLGATASWIRHTVFGGTVTLKTNQASDGTTTFSGSGSSQFYHAAPPPSINCRFSADVSYVTSVSQKAAIYLHIDTAQRSYYEMSFNNTSGNFELYRRFNTGGGSTAAVLVAGPYTPTGAQIPAVGVWQRWSIETVDGVVRGILNEDVILQYTDATPLTLGRMGFFGSSGGVMRYDNTKGEVIESG
jgi:hypothetical protein